MESLAVLVMTILLAIYGSGIIAFALSWFRNKVVRIITFVFAGFSIASGVWLAITLLNGNGLFLGSIPVILGAFSAWNSNRSARRPL